MLWQDTEPHRVSAGHACDVLGVCGCVQMGEKRCCNSTTAAFLPYICSPEGAVWRSAIKASETNSCLGLLQIQLIGLDLTYFLLYKTSGRLYWNLACFYGYFKTHLIAIGCYEGKLPFGLMTLFSSTAPSVTDGCIHCVRNNATTSPSSRQLSRC